MRFAFYDNKLGLDHAIALADEGHKVHYFHEWRYRYMRLEDYMVGRGIHQNLEVVEDVLGAIHSGVDVVFVADVGYGYFGDYVRDVLGIPVFGGSLLGDRLELSRIWAANTMKSVGIKTPEYVEVVGVDKLFDVGEVLGWDFFLKVDMVRGNMETTKIENRRELQVVLEGAGFGPLRDNVRFIVSRPVDGVEVGVDAWFDGEKFLRPYHFGNEVKGTNCCFGKWVYESIWDDVLDRMEKVLRGRYYGTISFEGIYDGKNICVIDVTSRLAKPAGSLQHYSFRGNYGDIVSAVASGRDVEFDLDPRGKYTVQLGLGFSEQNKWYNLYGRRSDIAVCLYGFGLDGNIWINNRDDIHGIVFYLGCGDDFEKLVNDAVGEAYKYSRDVDLVFSDLGVRRYREYLKKLQEFGVEW